MLQSVFTYNIFKALRCAPAALAEGNVSVRSMSGFVLMELPMATENRKNPKVYSLLLADFPLDSNKVGGMISNNSNCLNKL